VQQASWADEFICGIDRCFNGSKFQLNIFSGLFAADYVKAGTGLLLPLNLHFTPAIHVLTSTILDILMPPR